MATKYLILVRHAHRDTQDGRRLDNGLSEKGLAQAEEIAQTLIKKFGNEIKDASLYSSPKKRCIQTLEPLAKKIKKEIVSDQDLEEGGRLIKKIQSFTETFEHGVSNIVIACSHGDWIPEFIEINFSLFMDIKKGELIYFEFTDHKFKIIN